MPSFQACVVLMTALNSLPKFYGLSLLMALQWNQIKVVDLVVYGWKLTNWNHRSELSLFASTIIKT